MRKLLFLVIYFSSFFLFSPSSSFAAETENAADFNSVNWKTVTVAEIQELIKNGADINAKDAAGWTALASAARNSFAPQTIDVLIQNGANVNEKYTDGSTPLMLAAGFNTSEKILSALLRNGADINAKSNEGWTALTWAA